MPGEVLGVERQRCGNDDDKLAIVSSVDIDGATVTQIAYRHDVSSQQIYRWRRKLKKKGLWPTGVGAVFMPIDFLVAEMAAPKLVPASPLEQRLSNGHWLRFCTGVDAAALSRLLRAVDAA